jgi:hyperosmotically inducible protein
MRNMRLLAVMAAFALVLAVGCSKQRANNPSVKDNVENSLKQAGFDKINVDEDRDKGVVTLKGEVASADDKTRAEDTARAAAGNNIVANEILVTGEDKGQAKDVADKTDGAIEARWKEYVAANNLNDQHIRADAKNGVLTLKGDVDTADQRAQVEKDAAQIGGVTQVVNKLEVKANKKGHAAKSSR